MFKLFKFIFRLVKFIIGLAIWGAVLLLAGYIALCLLFPVKHMDIINEYSEKYGLEPAFVCAVINTESRFDESAQSHKGARGLMQLMPETVEWAVGEMGYESFDYSRIEEPEVNIEIGCWVLNFLSKQFDSNQELVAAAYNAGIGNVKKWLENSSYSNNGETLHSIPYGETAKYIKKTDLYTKIYRIILRTDLYELQIFK